MKRFVTIVILCCMTVHCAGRLGILSWIYNQRHVIAFELGFSSEKAIAECGTAFLDDGLVIVQQDDASQGVPSAVFQAKEIILFFEENVVDGFVLRELIRQQYPTDVSDQILPGVGPGIFHPPAIG